MIRKNYLIRENWKKKIDKFLKYVYDLFLLYSYDWFFFYGCCIFILYFFLNRM